MSPAHYTWTHAIPRLFYTLLHSPTRLTTRLATRLLHVFYTLLYTYGKRATIPIATSEEMSSAQLRSKWRSGSSCLLPIPLPPTPLPPTPLPVPLRVLLPAPLPAPLLVPPLPCLAPAAAAAAAAGMVARAAVVEIDDPNSLPPLPSFSSPPRPLSPPSSFPPSVPPSFPSPSVPSPSVPSYSVPYSPSPARARATSSSSRSTFLQPCSPSHVTHEKRLP